MGPVPRGSPRDVLGAETRYGPVSALVVLGANQLEKSRSPSFCCLWLCHHQLAYTGTAVLGSSFVSMLLLTLAVLWVSHCYVPSICSPMDCSPTGSSIHGISQARILEWVALPFSRGSSQPRDRTQVFCIAGRLFTIWERVTENLSKPRESEWDSWDLKVDTRLAQGS